MVDIYIDIVCNHCGKDIIAEHYKNKIIVTPCEKCLEDTHEEAYNDGVVEGETR